VARSRLVNEPCCILTDDHSVDARPLDHVKACREFGIASPFCLGNADYIDTLA
jgi:hypothetical protein